MTTIAHWAEQPQPIEADASIDAVRARFEGDPSLSAVAVTDQGALVGVVGRDLILAADAGPATGLQPVARLMARPRTLPAATPAADALASLLAGGGLPEAVILVDDDRYAGLITQASLLSALQARADRGASDGEHRREFVEMLGREIRASMTGVLAVAGLLQRQPLTPDAQAFARTIVDSSETLLRLLDDALDLAMGETGQLEPKPEPMVLRVAMDEIQAEWQSDRASNVAVLVSYDGEPELGVMVDGARLRQVFNNLIAAAVKTTRRGAVEASLKARPMVDGVRLEGRVRDAGAGLAPEHLARIFEPSVRSQDRGRSGWAGLGPALCRRLIEAMHGTIRAESNVGEGVTVTFELMTPKMELAAVGRDAAEPSRARGAHVLVVDDNATNRMVAEGLCEMFDCTSECAEDGLEALEAAKSGRYDLILMDIKMPRMDGMEAARAIRSLPGPAGQVPIIALTANADPEDAKTYLACGMFSVVEKPIKPEKLLGAMNAALEQPVAGGAIRAA